MNCSENGKSSIINILPETVERRKMGFINLLKNIFTQEYYYEDEDEFEYEDFDMIEDAEKMMEESNKKKKKYSTGTEEEERLNRQLTEHVSNVQLKEEYDNAVKKHAQKENREKKDKHVNRYSKDEVEKYVKSQCDFLNETSKYIDDAKEEYSVVTSYFSDIQLIDAAPPEIRKNITKVAQGILTLSVDRKIYHTTDKRLSNSVYAKMEILEPDMPKALVKLQNDESYYNTVKKDLKILEGERMSIRYDAKDLVKQQIHIKRVSTILAAGLSVVFFLFILAAFMLQDSETTSLFLTFVILSALLAIGLFALLRTIERKVMVTEYKLNRATQLLNKTKIKYINIANMLDYEYKKYGVKKSHELARQYETYLDVKREKEKISRLTDDLNASEEHLMMLLEGLGLYDTHIWITQVKALVDTREMSEIRHQLSLKRQKLRTQIEYDQNRVDEVKQNIMNTVAENPGYKDMILEMIENYENGR